MSPTDDDRLRQAIANARRLAAALVERDLGRAWDRPIEITTHRPDARPAPPAIVDRATSGGRVAVVTWDLGHNPAGRAMVLAALHSADRDVDLVGPLWARFGDRVWSPIEEAGLSTVAFGCTTMRDFAPRAYAIAARHRYELVHVSKPRLPGLILGSLIARASDCPLVLDIDDDELAFFAPDSPDHREPLPASAIDETHLAALAEPTEEIGTRLGVTLARSAAVRTVANIALADEFGGLMVRHARPETIFDPAAVSRERGRAALGATPRDIVVLFVGTPRPHKGLAMVVDALRRLDDRFVLHVVGADDPARVHAELDPDGTRVEVHPPVAYSVLPELLAGADAIALMQDPTDPISAFQIPSKVSDALALDRPLITTDVAPLADLGSPEVLRADDATGLAARLRSLADDDPATPGRRRALFLSEFSERVNQARVALAAEEAAAAHRSGTDPLVERTIELATTAFAATRPTTGTPSSAAGSSTDAVDLVVFWKQNDTGLYGRRCEMLTEHLARDARIGTVLHIDAPMSADRIGRDAMAPLASVADESPHRLTQLLDRRLGLADGAVHHRSFLFDDLDGRDPLTGDPLPRRDGFAEWVRTEMATLSMTPERSIAWVCPIVDDFEAVHDALGFGRVVVDLIDDERMLDVAATRRRELDAHYRSILAAADAVFTNCEPNAAAFAAHTDEITVVPNGADTSAFDPDRRTVGEGEPPVMAYVGHLSDRVDWDLLADVCRALPEHRLLLAGAARPGDRVHAFVAEHPNAELVGVLPYAELPAFLTGVDVAVIPHVAADQTERMNPLKAYNFAAAGIPIVATPIANLDEAIDTIAFADTPRAFAAAVEAAVQRRRRGDARLDATRLAAFDWSRRAEAVLITLERKGLLTVGRPDA